MTRRDVGLLAIGAGPANPGPAVAPEELAPELAENSLIIEQGINESTHGIGDSLFSVLAHRSPDRVSAVPAVAAEGNR
jgi:hypothetical protein